MTKLSDNPIPGGTNIATGVDEAVTVLEGKKRGRLPKKRLS